MNSEWEVWETICSAVVRRTILNYNLQAYYKLATWLPFISIIIKPTLNTDIRRLLTSRHIILHTQFSWYICKWYVYCIFVKAHNHNQRVKITSIEQSLPCPWISTDVLHGQNWHSTFTATNTLNALSTILGFHLRYLTAILVFIVICLLTNRSSAAYSAQKAAISAPHQISPEKRKNWIIPSNLSQTVKYKFNKVYNVRLMQKIFFYNYLNMTVSTTELKITVAAPVSGSSRRLYALCLLPPVA